MAETSLPPADSTMFQAALVGRQPIFNEGMDIFAYELLYRDGQANYAEVVDGEEATARVLVNTFLELGIEKIAGQAHVFINVTKDFLLNKHYSVLSPEKVVLEVLEHIDPSPEILQVLQEARNDGYRIALDDFVVTDATQALLSVADLVKVDVLSLSSQQLVEQVERLRPYNLDLLAEKVEDLACFEQCVQLGFTYFQGYFFCKPQIVEGTKISNHRMATIMLLAKLQNPDIQIPELEELVKTDLPLSVKLIRYVNSASVGLSRPVDSIAKAVTMVGIDRMRQWASLLLLAGNGGKPPELMRVALIRAHMCEAMGHRRGTPENQGFTVGLFSVLDAFFDCSMTNLLEELPLADEITQALLFQVGPLGETLKDVVEYERGGDISHDLGQGEFEQMQKFYWESVAWTEGIMNSMGPVAQKEAGKGGLPT